MPHPPPDPQRPGSTGSHTAPVGDEKPLSDLLRAGGSSRRAAAAAAGLAAHLGNSAPAPAANTDDSPTVITGNKSAAPLPPPPQPYVVGDTPTLAGRRLGHFELIEAVGAGGMAAVLKARDLELGRIVALKILPPESAHDPENVARFKSEARAAAKLDHENIARVYFCGEDQHLHFIAFEFVEGVNLRGLIDRTGTLSAADAVRYMIQVAAGLAHAAERGVVHRDIKPSNIVITPDGRAKIVDMGLARHLDAGNVNGGVTQSGVTLGTFDYISPEQALDPRRADVRSDLYSLGCTFYHALAGRPPVPEGTAAKKLHAHQHEEPLDPRELNPYIPDALAAVLGRMMAKDPAKRYQTPAELIAHLKSLADTLFNTDFQITDSAVKAIPAAPVLRAEPLRIPLAWAIPAVAVAAAVAVIVASAGGPGDPLAPPPWDAHPNKAADLPAVADAPPPVSPKAAPDAGPPADAAALAAALKAGGPVVLKPDGRYDLTTLDEAIVVRGDRLDVTGDPGRPAVVRVVPVVAGADPPHGALVLDGLKGAGFTNVRFEFAPPDDGGDVDDPLPAAALAATDVADLRFTDCQFRPTARRQKLAAVSVARRNGTAPAVRLDRCLFHPGATGVRVSGKSAVVAFDCGFGPLDAAFRLKPDAGGGGATVRLERSSFAVGPNGAVAAADDRAAGKVVAGYCVFGPTVATDPEHPPVLLAVKPGGRTDSATFEAAAGEKNVAYGVDPGAADPASAAQLKARPWATADVAGALAGANPHAAFALKVTGSDADRDIFTRTDFTVLGAQFATGPGRRGLAYADAAFTWPPQPPPLPAREVKQKTWWPDAPADGLQPGTYTHLQQLLPDLRSGDEVLVRHTGPLPVEPVEFTPPGADRGNFQVTFRAAPDHRPVLQLDPENKKLFPALFRLMDGRVVFKRLEFRLRGSAAHAPQTLAAVAVVGARECTFEDCVFTLGDDSATRAAAVQLVDPAGEMAMAPAGGRPAPDIQFRRCLLRGKGRGVWVAGSRPFQVAATNTVAALDGALVGVDHATKEPGGAEQAGLNLTNVTVLGGPVVEEHAGKLGEAGTPGLVPLDVTATRCLFAAVPGAPRPLLDLTGLTPADARDGKVNWKSNDSRYANFDPAAVFAVFHPRADEPAPPKTWGWNPWADFAGGTERLLGRVTFRTPPAANKLRAVKPDDLRATVEFAMLPDAKPDDAGAPPRDVPTPQPEE